ncbi:choice-of-anchor D domain-containing protein [Corallococcus exiguus]|uniref:choice-of-anchor D domain-containing protein n=1 Tax=Corallococcus exiguus TaxID=83462 RepID=UPI00156159FD|nr:choice-of-anchor D domain-containing protein [Corallococcus exiguus]NRD55438.1 choice-of-anchor D domain-containing protein [Corallococcus exiguus]
MFRKSLSLMLLLGAPILFGACSDEPAAALVIDRKSFDFGDVEVGKFPVEQLFTVRNASPQDVESVSVSVEGSEFFAITSNTCEKYLAAGMECEVRVRFAPLLGGTHSARLKVTGADSVNPAELQGTAFVWVDVTSMPPGTRVVAGDDSFTCTQPCRHAVRKTELTLYAGPEGFPTWGNACANVARGGCLLHLSASRSVALVAFSPLYQWEVLRSSPPMTVAPLADGNIVVQDALGVTSLDRFGYERWSVPVSSMSKLVVTSDWYLSVLSYNGTVTQYDGDGRVRWTYTPPQQSSSEGHVVADVFGNTYVLMTQGSHDTALAMKLVALSREGVERWSTVISEAQLNSPFGLGVMGDGTSVYVGGNAYTRGTNPQDLVFVKSFIRKLTPVGGTQWTKEGSWGAVAFTLSGEMVSFINNGTPPGGFTAAWFDSAGNALWNTQTSPGQGPGLVDAHTFPSNFNLAPRLLLGGHEMGPGTNVYTYGRGWFADMGDRSKLAPGPITYIDSPLGNGAWVSTLAYADLERHVVVGGGFGTLAEPAGGFIRLYDPRTLTMER